VIVDAQTIPFIDVSAARMLRELADDVRRDGIARDIGQVRDVLRATEAGTPLVEIHPSVQDAVDAILAGEVSARR
jgi:sulfate permease, SulP family